MSKVCNLKVGGFYSCLYPRYNYSGLPERFEPRRFRVVRIRDLKHDRLDPSTKQLNPTLKRGRWLITVEDLDKGAERHFYLESMRDIQPFAPRRSPRFTVVTFERVRFASEDLASSMAFKLGAKGGTIYGRMSD